MEKILAEEKLDEELQDDTGEKDESLDSTDIKEGEGDEGTEDDENTESWMKEDDDDQTDSSIMPVSAHIRAKRKLKGKITDRDTEIEKLRRENEALKANKPPVKPVVDLPKRPREVDFETTDEYNQALDEYYDKRLDSKLSVVSGQRQLQDAQKKAIKKLDDDVDNHYVRADKLIESSGISAETYKQADEAIRNAVETVKPGQGNLIVDQMISLLGDGSEKVMYKLGRSKALRGELITLLIEDPHGLKATAFLGEQRALLLNTRKRTSQALPPDTQLSGSGGTPAKETAFKKKYDAAHNGNNAQAAYNAKKEAKATGIDVSKW